MFLQEHEEEIIAVFHEEIQRLDDEIPEEQAFIDIKMVPLGEVILKASLRAICRFLTNDIPEKPAADIPAVVREG